MFHQVCDECMAKENPWFFQWKLVIDIIENIVTLTTKAVQTQYRQHTKAFPASWGMIFVLGIDRAP